MKDYKEGSKNNYLTHIDKKNATNKASPLIHNAAMLCHTCLTA